MFLIEALTEEPQLSKIEFIQEEYSFVISSRQRLNNLAQLDLINGLKDRKEIQVSNSLQVHILK